MALLQPTLEDYQSSAQKLGHWFSAQNVEYVIYGSFCVPNKLRPGLSDIDIFAHVENPAILFPLEITRAFGEIRTRIDSLGIPLQINWSTSGQMRSRVFDVDTPYVSEVQKGLSSPHKSSRIEQILSAPREGDSLDDQHMMRYFRRKMTNLGEHLYEAEQVLTKNAEEFTPWDQKVIWTLWDDCKKMISLISISIRIKRGESLFHLKDREILEHFQKVFPHEGNYDSYRELLESIRNIRDWYEFLKVPSNRKTLSKLYSEIFEEGVSAISASNIERNS